MLVIDKFLDALPDPDIRLSIRETRLREAENFTITLETYKIADAQTCVYVIKWVPDGNQPKWGDISHLHETFN